MKLTAKSGAGSFKGAFVVRDKDGKPKFDDPNSVPQIILDALSPADLEYLEQLRQQSPKEK